MGREGVHLGLLQHTGTSNGPTEAISEPRDATLHHLNALAPRDSVFLAWQAQFIPACGSQRPVSGDELLPEEVLAYVETLDHGTPDAREVSLLIAEAFDPGFQGSTVDIVTVFKGKHSAKHLQHTLMRLRNVWVFRKSLQAEKAKGYKLTRRHTAAILALRPRSLKRS